MKLRIVPLFGIAAAIGLAFLLSRNGPGNGAAEVEPRQASDSGIELSEPALATQLATTTPEPGRTALSAGEQAGDPALAEQVPSQQAATFAIGGSVVDDAGDPVTKFSIEAELVGTGGPRRGGGGRVQRSFEGQDGNFRIDVLAAGQWQLTARTRGDRRSAPALATLPEQAEEIVLILSRLGSISGTVLGQGRAPVAEASVHLVYPGERYPDFSFGGTPKARAVTDGSGGFRLREILPCDVRVMARHPDYSDSEWITVTVAPNELVGGVEIVLSQGGRIEGVVDHSLGEVSARQIHLYSSRGTIGWRKARTDAAGRFVIENVMPQDYIVELRAVGDGEPGFEYQPGIRKTISVEDGRTTQVVFGGARRQIQVHGTVLSRGAPAPGLKVRAYSRESEDRAEESATGPDGRFELNVDGPGGYSFSVSANHGSYVRFERTVPDQQEVELTFEVPSGALRGRVLGSDGEPLGRVPITTVRSGQVDRRTFYRDHFRRMYTDGDGTFEFRLLAPGSYTLRAPDGFQSDSPPPRVPYGRVVVPDLQVGSSEVSGIAIRLLPECRVSGTVVDARGSPVAAAWIRLLDQRELSLSAVWEAQTKATGQFEIENVAPGTYTVRVWSHGHDVTSLPFTVDAGMTANPRIELR